MLDSVYVGFKEKRLESETAEAKNKVQLAIAKLRREFLEPLQTELERLGLTMKEESESTDDYLLLSVCKGEKDLMAFAYRSGMSGFSGLVTSLWGRKDCDSWAELSLKVLELLGKSQPSFRYDIQLKAAAQRQWPEPE